MPSGAAHNVVLLNEGFFRVFGIGQLLDSPTRRCACSHSAGRRRDRLHRQLHRTPHRHRPAVHVGLLPDHRSAAQQPRHGARDRSAHLNAATGLKLTLADCKVVFTRFFEFISFERTADHLLDKRYPLQLDNVYAPQIEAAKKGGIYRAGDHVTPEDIFVGTRLYRILTELKRRYEDL
jgi:hypothetical protein